MALGLVPVLILFGILCCVNAEIYVYKENFLTRVAQFHDILSKYGPGLPLTGLTGYPTGAEPSDGCSPMEAAPDSSFIVIISRGNCSYEVKVRNAQDANYSAVIVHNVQSNDLVPMYYENSTGIEIPAVFVSEVAGLTLLAQVEIQGTFVTIDEEFIINTNVLFGFTVFVFSIFVFMLCSMCVRYIRNRRRRRRRLLPASILKSLPRQKYTKDLNYDTCVICQDNFKLKEMLRILPCSHGKCWAEDITLFSCAGLRILPCSHGKCERSRDELERRLRVLRALAQPTNDNDPEAGPSSTAPDPPSGDRIQRVLIVHSVNIAPEDNLSTTNSDDSAQSTRNRLVQFIQGLFDKMKPDTASQEQNRRIEDLEREESQRRDSGSTSGSGGSEDLIYYPAESPHSNNTQHPEC
ncbi:hypothetical protein WDU94_002393 [Cyamophila willieti]